MKFDSPTGENPIDRQQVVGLGLARIEGPLKVSGRVPYAYEYHDAAPNAAYGWIRLAGIGKGRIVAIDTAAAEAAPGVLLVYTYRNVPKKGPREGRAGSNLISQLDGPEVHHHGQAVGFVVAETLEQARVAAALIDIRYAVAPGRFDLAAERFKAAKPADSHGPADTAVGNFDAAFAASPMRLDATYTTPDQSHAMMEPQASTAVWHDGKLTLYCAHQMANWAVGDIAAMLEIPEDDVRIVAAYVGGGFGSKLRTYADAPLSAMAARALGRPVKTALTRQQVPNHTTHRGATIQRVRIGAERDGRITAIGHETWTGNLEGRATYEEASRQTRLMYAGANRMTAHRLAAMDMPESSSMRAPGEAAGMLALEIAMDELAEAVGIDPVELRIRNDTPHDPERGPDRPFSTRQLVACLREGAARFGWDARPARPGQWREGRWLVGMGVAGAIRGNPLMPAKARLQLQADGRLTIQTSMTDIGTGTYTILAQVAAEALGVPVDAIAVELGDTAFPAGPGSGGSFGASSTGSAVFDASMVLRAELARRGGFDPATAAFQDGRIFDGNRSHSLGDLAGAAGLEATGTLEPGDLEERFAQAAFGAHFCEVGVDIETGETRVRRMLGVFAAGRVLNAKTARSQAIGGMVFGIGAALTEELVPDRHHGYFVNHDMAEYHVPVHADVPAIETIFLPEADDKANPLKSKGIGELGICGAGAAIANAIHNATGIRLRDYPMTLDKLLPALPSLA